jgi:hypothetical protein
VSKVNKYFLTALVVFITASSIADNNTQIGFVMWDTTRDNADNSVLYGPKINITLENDWWLAARGTFGTVNFDNNKKRNEADFEALLGNKIELLDIGAGVKYISQEMSQGKREKTNNGYGPLLYLGLTSPFGDSPVGFYTSASWMPSIIGDDEIGPHYNLEGGLFFSIDKTVLTLGYRYKNNYDTNYEVRGITGSIAMIF